MARSIGVSRRRSNSPHPMIRVASTTTSGSTGQRCERHETSEDSGTHDDGSVAMPSSILTSNLRIHTSRERSEGNSPHPAGHRTPSVRSPPQSNQESPAARGCLLLGRDVRGEGARYKKPRDLFDIKESIMHGTKRLHQVRARGKEGGSESHATPDPASPASKEHCLESSSLLPTPDPHPSIEVGVAMETYHESETRARAGRYREGEKGRKRWLEGSLHWRTERCIGYDLPSGKYQGLGWQRCGVAEVTSPDNR